MEGFADLPDALVRDLLATAVPIAERVTNHIQRLCNAKQQMREEAQANGLIRRKDDLDVPREPSVVGVDGSYQIHRLTAFDLSAAAAVAVEGTAKEERRHWQEPYHEMWIECLPHQIDAVGVLRGMMVSMEMKLAANAPHDLVLLDGSFASLIIYLNQALTKTSVCASKIRDEFLRRWNDGLLNQLRDLLRSNRTAAMPKYTSRNEFIQRKRINVPETVDGKTLATLILEPGEYSTPLQIYSEDDPESMKVDHLPAKYCPKNNMEDLVSALEAMRVIYFRPFGWLPAMRMELPGSIASSNTRLSMVLDGVKRQLFSPAVIEPYPLFLADRMVKSLGAGVAVVEQTVAQHSVGQLSDPESTMLYLQNYRTEGGRGGV